MPLSDRRTTSPTCIALAKEREGRRRQPGPSVGRSVRRACRQAGTGMALNPRARVRPPKPNVLSATWRDWTLEGEEGRDGRLSRSPARSAAVASSESSRRPVMPGEIFLAQVVLTPPPFQDHAFRPPSFFCSCDRKAVVCSAGAGNAGIPCRGEGSACTSLCRGQRQLILPLARAPSSAATERRRAPRNSAKYSTKTTAKHSTYM